MKYFSTKLYLRVQGVCRGLILATFLPDKWSCMGVEMWLLVHMTDDPIPLFFGFQHPYSSKQKKGG
jgi:hypothetical protein